MIENSFGDLVEYDPAICSYVELTAFALEKDYLSDKIQLQIEKMIKESNDIKKVFDTIKKKADSLAIRTAREYMSVSKFDPALMSILRFVFCEEINIPKSISDYCDDKYELYNKHHKFFRNS